MTHGKMSKSEKFPPPHEDGAFGACLDISNNRAVSFDPTERSFDSSFIDPKLSKSKSVMEQSSMRKKPNNAPPYMAPSRKLLYAFKPSSIGLSLGMMRGKVTSSRK